MKTFYYSERYSISFKRLKDNLVKNSWINFYLIPSQRPSVTPPKPNLIFVQIPLSNKIVDLTTSLGPVTYEGSEGSWEFYIDHNLWETWYGAKAALEDYFDGSAFRVRLLNKIDDENGLDYIGTLKVESYAPGSDYSKVRIGYNLNYPNADLNYEPDTEVDPTEPSDP